MNDCVVKEITDGDEMCRYYDLRWRLLRYPLGLKRGTERDEFERNGFHVGAFSSSKDIVGIGRAHLSGPRFCRVRFMGVKNEYRGAGLGSKILGCLENHAWDNGAVLIWMNARYESVEFYHKNGYDILEDGPTLYGKLKHIIMIKTAPE